MATTVPAASQVQRALPKELSPQERRFIGSSETYGSNFYIPSVLTQTPSAFAQVEDRRRATGFMDVSPLIIIFAGNSREVYKIDLPPLDPRTGETLHDPAIWRESITRNGEKELILDKELTVKVYTEMQDSSDFSLFHREGKWKWEREAGSIEGNMQDLESYTPPAYRK